MRLAAPRKFEVGIYCFYFDLTCRGNTTEIEIYASEGSKRGERNWRSRFRDEQSVQASLENA